MGKAIAGFDYMVSEFAGLNEQVFVLGRVAKEKSTGMMSGTFFRAQPFEKMTAAKDRIFINIMSGGSGIEIEIRAGKKTDVLPYEVSHKFSNGAPLGALWDLVSNSKFAMTTEDYEAAEITDGSKEEAQYTITSP